MNWFRDEDPMLLGEDRTIETRQPIPESDCVEDHDDAIADLLRSGGFKMA